MPTYNEKNETFSAPVLKTIGAEAFYNCIGFKKLNLEANTVLETVGAKAFYQCTNIETMILPRSVTSIGEYAFAKTTLTTVSMASDVLSKGIFSECSSLTEINIQDNIFTSVPDYAFYNCQEFKTDNIFTEVESIGDHSFYHVGFDSFVLSDNCESIGDYAFGNNKESIKQIDLNKVKTIGDYAFWECQQLVDVTIPSSVEEIGKHLFEDCTELEEVTFKVNILNEYMFSGCSKLTTVNFLNGGNQNDTSKITKVPAYCFNDCSQLSTLSIISTESPYLTEIGAFAFNNTAFDKISLTNSQNTIGRNAFSNMQSLTEATINVAMISAQMFYNSKTLAKVTIGSNVLNVINQDATDPEDVIDGGAFQKCINLKTIIIQNKVIGDYMFDNCSGLVSITIPAGVDLIGEHALSNCGNLSTVVLNNTVLGASMFENDSNLHTISLSSQLAEIPYRAFYKSYLTSVVIPASVQNVGDEAFADSKSLASVTLNNSKDFFSNFKACFSSEKRVFRLEFHLFDDKILHVVIRNVGRVRRDEIKFARNVFKKVALNK